MSAKEHSDARLRRDVELSGHLGQHNEYRELLKLRHRALDTPKGRWRGFLRKVEPEAIEFLLSVITMFWGQGFFFHDGNLQLAALRLFKELPFSAAEQGLAYFALGVFTIVAALSRSFSLRCIGLFAQVFFWLWVTCNIFLAVPAAPGLSVFFALALMAGFAAVRLIVDHAEDKLAHGARPFYGVLPHLEADEEDEPDLPDDRAQ